MNTFDDISYCIDWVTATFDFIQFDDYKAPEGSILRNRYEDGKHKLNHLYNLLTYPNFDERTEEVKKFGEYKQRVFLGEFISLFFNGCKNSKNLHHSKLEMSGNACRDFIDRGGNWFDLFEFFLTYEGKVNGIKPTRIDAAIDVKTNKYFDFDKILKYTIDECSYSSPSRDISLTTSKRRLKDKLYNRGRTIYLGSETSAVYLCIYDKLLERRQAGDETDYGTDVWYRIELRFRDEQASWFLSEFLKTKDRQDYSFIMNALYKVLDIKEIDSEQKALRNRPTADWWLKFLDDSSKAKLNDKPIKSITLKKKEKYLEVNSGMAITQVLYSCKSPVDFFKKIFNIIDLKTDDLDHRKLKQINEFRESEGLEKLNLDEILQFREMAKAYLERGIISNE